MPRRQATRQRLRGLNAVAFSVRRGGIPDDRAAALVRKPRSSEGSTGMLTSGENEAAAGGLVRSRLLRDHREAARLEASSVLAQGTDQAAARVTNMLDARPGRVFRHVAAD